MGHPVLGIALGESDSGYMVIPDTWSILAGPDADQVSGTHCTAEDK